MIIEQQSGFSLAIDECNGALVSISNGRREFLHPGGHGGTLFTIRFRDSAGRAVETASNQARGFRIKRGRENGQTTVEMEYSQFDHPDIQVKVWVRCPDDQPFSYWRLAVENRTGLVIDWIDFPGIVVPNDLPATGGSAAILWPAMEGALIGDVAYREENWVKYSPVEYPNKGFDGYYPGPCPIQMMAYYDGSGGLYAAAHDADFNVKAVEYYPHNGGIKLEFRLFPGAGGGSYEMEYDMVLGLFQGDWHDAAEIYRAWRQGCGGLELSRLADRSDLPEWMEESPVTVVYPVRGQMHLGDMTPNKEFFPFTNALPVMRSLADGLDSKLLALPMQWEGTAPWAPPYVWPPLGGAENFEQFVEALHAEGHYAGVYCSGIAWTNQSGLVPEYDRQQEFDEGQLIDVMCDSPEGEPSSGICQGPIRTGYDMCPAHEFTHKVSIAEIRKIAASGCDYIQYFDQNLGGASYFCYSKHHGHPPVPGKWQIEAMRGLMRELTEAAQSPEREIVIGCEGAAAEPYMDLLPFNDLRFEINYMTGTPVPLYAYVYHEYVNNFTGNQNGTGTVVDFAASPLNLLQRIAYSFVAGDMLTVVLADQGRIHWDWCTPWEVEKPDQESTMALIRCLNAWRRGAGKPFLQHGRMAKPYPLAGLRNIPMMLNNGKELAMPSLLTSRWLTAEGRNAQVVVNYTLEEQRFEIRPAADIGRVDISRRPDAEAAAAIRDRHGLTCAIPALSAMMMEFSNEQDE
ncbi:MAG: hypothetical protein K0R57_4105 [Paenibacillaceae bacterium]|nr:hypothetical protein [Paenibacillaceae bacterium]